MNPLSTIFYMLALFFMLNALILAQIGELTERSEATGVFVPSLIIILVAFVFDTLIWSSEEKKP